MPDTLHSLIIVLICAGIVILLRILPFLLFPAGKKTPKLISYLSKVLPCAVMGMLVVYCLKDTTPLEWPYALPELISILTVILLYIWKRNTLLCVLVGTVGYMLLVQFVFV